MYTLLSMRSSRPTSSLWSPPLQSSRPSSGFRRAKTEVLFGSRRVVNIGTTVTEHSACFFPLFHWGSLDREASEGVVLYAIETLTYWTSLVLKSGSWTCLQCKSQKVSLTSTEDRRSSALTQLRSSYARGSELDVSPGLESSQ